MLTVNVKQLVSAIEEADIFKLPEMNRGTQYLYDKIYGRLSEGREIRLSEVDFGSFEADDIDSMRELYSDTLEENGRRADSLARTLQCIEPLTAASAFV